MNRLLAAAALLLVGCATTYQPQALTGGFSETQLSQNVWLVNFAGNAYTSTERAADFALLRSAELMLNNGYKYFVVVDSEADAVQYTYSAPATSTTNLHGTVSTTGRYDTFSATATTTTYGGQVYTMYKPRTGLIVAGIENPPSNAVWFDAEFLENSLKDKYDIAP